MPEKARFVIVGGGTAGWITALILQDAIQRKKLDASVTVVEPWRIPTVGVGEATTAAFYVFLKTFGIDEFEFFRKTGATFKLGIRHEDWRRKGYTYYGPIDDPHQVVQAPAGTPSDYLNIYAVAAGRPIALFKLSDGVFATDAICTHGNANLCGGFVEDDGQIECPLHQGRFDIRSGKALCEPLAHDLVVHPVRIEGGRVFVQIAPAA